MEDTKLFTGKKQDNRIQLRFDSNFWDAYWSVLGQAVELLRTVTGAKVELQRSRQHLGGMLDPHTGLEYREYFHLAHKGVVWTVPISLYTPEVLAQWFAEKLDIAIPKRTPKKVELPQPSNPVGLYLGDDFYGPAAGDKLPIGSLHRPEGADYHFRKIRRSPFDVMGVWRKEPLAPPSGEAA
jgi:hypothetical protein